MNDIHQFRPIEDSEFPYDTQKLMKYLRKIEEIDSRQKKHTFRNMAMLYGGGILASIWLLVLLLSPFVKFLGGFAFFAVAGSLFLIATRIYSQFSKDKKNESSENKTDNTSEFIASLAAAFCICFGFGAFYSIFLYDHFKNEHDLWEDDEEFEKPYIPLVKIVMSAVDEWNERVPVMNELLDQVGTDTLSMVMAEVNDLVEDEEFVRSQLDILADEMRGGRFSTPPEESVDELRRNYEDHFGGNVSPHMRALEKAVKNASTSLKQK